MKLKLNFLDRISISKRKNLPKHKLLNNILLFLNLLNIGITSKKDNKETYIALNFHGDFHNDIFNTLV